jgi:hypothetical protein
MQWENSKAEPVCRAAFTDEWCDSGAAVVLLLLLLCVLWQRVVDTLLLVKEY